MKWRGVIPAITTAFKADLSVDHEFVAKHATWLVDNGCSGIVALGSLGEGGTLRMEEKEAVLRTLRLTVKRLYPWAHARGAVSSGVADDLARLSGLPRDSIDVIHNPISLPAEAAGSPADEMWPPTRARVCGNGG